MKATLDIASIVARYNAGVGLRKLGIASHIDPERIREVLVAAGVVIRPVGSNGSHPAPLDIASIIERYNDGVGLRKLGIACYCDPERVRETLVAAGVAIRPKGSNGSSTAPLDVASIIERYNAGEAMSTIATSIGRGLDTVRNALDESGTAFRQRGHRASTKAGTKPHWRTCIICNLRIPTVSWHEHQRTVHTAPATPTAIIRRNVAAYIKAYEAKPTPALPYCIGCRQRPCITPTCCGRRLRTQTQHANRKVL